MKTITIDGIEYQLTPVTTEAPKPVQWEPKQVEKYKKYFSLSLTGYVTEWVEETELHDELCASFGNYFHTKQETEEAAKQVRQLLRLRAYVREFAPYWEADWSDCRPDWGDSSEQKWYIYFDERYKEWSYGNNQFMHSVTTVYMPEDVAIELAHKLNSGEVVL